MSVRQRVAEIIDGRMLLSGRQGIGQELADRLAAEGLLNVREIYASLGELTGGDSIILGHGKHGPSVYKVTARADNQVTGDSEIIGVRDHTDDDPQLILVGPANMHVRKVVE